MGKCESATISIGIKILLSALIEQINESNIKIGTCAIDIFLIFDRILEIIEKILCTKEVGK